MRKYGLILVLVLLAGGMATYYFTGDRTADASGAGAGQARGFGGGFGGFGGARGPRPPMTVELVTVSRADMVDQITVVGNLIGAATVDAVPKAAGRLEQVFVRMGDRVSRGQRLAKIEDHEILEQVKQARASYNVSQATIRQREADLKFAQNNLDRSRSLYERQLLPRQTMDDAEARYQAALAQLDLANAQFEQSKARLDELEINLTDTVISAPVDGFIGKRTLDPGASVGPNTSFISVVDIQTVRLVVNVVERDLRRIAAGVAAETEVDAYPGETFQGRVARVAPILDPATRTAQVEIEIPNPTFRLKPGMYARVRFTVENHPKTLVVPTASVVDVSGKIGVFVPESDTAAFRPVKVGIENTELTEITDGLQEGERIVSTGAAALREGDRILLMGGRAGGDGAVTGGRRAGGAGGRPADNAPENLSGQASQGNEASPPARRGGFRGGDGSGGGRRGGRAGSAPGFGQ